MKYSINPIIGYSLLIIILLAAITLIFVSIKVKNDDLIRERERIISKTNALENEKISLIARYQELTTESRITEIALNELNLIKNLEPVQYIEVSNTKIENINLILKRKYE